MRFATQNETPLVSICLLTYKHERWIKEAIDSVLMQETDFPCEFIIAEDCSPDKTREIVLSYAAKYPIRLILQEKNVGAMPNWQQLLNSPTGKYVAYLEGDDSWIDPLKLKKQVDVLEQNEDVAICYSNAKMFDTQNPDSVIFFKEGLKPPQKKDCYYAVVACPAPSCTLFYRNLMKIPDWALKVRAGDHLMIALVGKYGSAYYMDECLGLYNHDYTGLSRLIGQEHYLFDDFSVWLHLYEYYNYDPMIWDSVVQKGYCDIDKLFYRGWPPKARALFWKWPFKRVVKVKRLRFSILKMAIKLHTPYFRDFRNFIKK
ncbi:MAG: glycosyltransferase [Ferruginibacter sp.]